MHTIAIFEDKGPIADELKRTIEASGSVRTIRFSAEDSDPRKPPEDIIGAWLKKQPKLPDMILTDRDLSKLEHIALSSLPIIEAARRAGIPLCLYAQNLKPVDETSMKRIRRWSDGFIALDGTLSTREIGKQSVAMLDGFIDLRRGIASQKKKNKPAPAAIIAELLGEPSLMSKLSLYVTGDSDKLADILSIASYSANKKDIAELHRRIPITVGYWLWESVLRYPGIILDSVAASSYLNIDPKDFEKDVVQDVFKGARYKGPFHAARNLWYRHKLADMVAKGGQSDGLEYLKSKKINVSRCNCSVNPKMKAGFVCIVTNKPVSKEYSVGGISWIPAGADLSRVSKKVFDELAVWLGL